MALIVLALTASFVVLANGEESKVSYCDIKTCLKDSHTLCINSPIAKVEKCGEVKSYGLTEAERQSVLDAHNEYRAFVASGEELRGNPGPQPAATNLNNLEWDDELALIAQAWANKCNFGRDICRNVDRFEVGQNDASVGTTGNDDIPVSKLVALWYNEVTKFDNTQVESVTEFARVRHYTQMMWANTTHVGCGAIRFTNKEWNRVNLICNYGPAGNIPGLPMYKTY